VHPIRHKAAFCLAVIDKVTAAVGGRCRLGYKKVRAVGWAWQVAVNLFVLVIISSMFRVAHTAFETVVIAALVLVYEAVVWNAITLSRQALAVEHRNYARFLELRTVAGQPSEPDEREHLNTLNKQLETPGFWINAVVISLASLWASWQIVSTVL
jgi:hypothetical protein